MCVWGGGGGGGWGGVCARARVCFTKNTIILLYIIIVDLVKCVVLALIGEMRCDRNDRYYYYFPITRRPAYDYDITVLVDWA